MTNITEKARYSGVDACDAEVRVRETDPKFVHLMDEFTNKLSSKYSLEELIEFYELVNQKNSPVFADDERYRVQQKAMAKILARSYLTKIAEELEARLMIPYVADVATAAFNSVRSINDDVEVANYLDLTFSVIKEVKEIDDLRMTIENLDEILPESNSALAEIKAKDAAWHYYAAACEECGVEVSQLVAAR